MGRDLESLVREFGPVPAARAGYLLRQVCHSLADAHARGLVHRDIKPANIYVCRMGLEYDFVKVLDFGLVKLNSQASTERMQTLMTADQRTTGTPAYMAPEIILGETNVDRRADVYALGCVAYYLLTGQLVFEADTPMKMLLQHVQAEPIPPSQRTELPIPRELDELVLACLQKDPNKRPQNAEVLLDMACGCKTGDCWNQDLAKGMVEQAPAGIHRPSVAWRLRAVGVADADGCAAVGRVKRDTRSDSGRTPYLTIGTRLEIPLNSIRASIACVATVSCLCSLLAAFAQVQAPAPPKPSSFARMFETTIDDFRRLPSQDTLTVLGHRWGDRRGRSNQRLGRHQRFLCNADAQARSNRGRRLAARGRSLPARSRPMRSGG